MRSSALWQGLLDGRWSIIGRYDRDDRQVLVARLNDAALTEARALTVRERQIVEHAAMGKSNKQVACEVGLSIGSVSGYLAGALRKMGLRSRAELVVVAAPSEMPMADTVTIDQAAATAPATVAGRGE